MKYRFRLLLQKIWLGLTRVYLNRLLKYKFVHVKAVFKRAYIEAAILLPETKLKYNFDLSLICIDKIFDLPSSEIEQDIDRSHIDSLCNTLLKDDWVKKTVSNYYLFDALYYSQMNISDTFKEKIDAALEKANLYVDDAEPLTVDGAEKIIRGVKKTFKELEKESRIVTRNKITYEKLKVIEPIKITSAHVIFLASLFSTLFLVSGFAYTNIFFSYFGFNASDFFQVSDYISSSVDVLIPTVIATVIGIFMFFWGLSDSISRDLCSEQFEIDMSVKGEKWIVPYILGVSAIGLVSRSYVTGELERVFLLPIVFFTGLYLLDRLPIWKYVENKVTVKAVLFSVCYFLMHLGFEAKNNIDKIQSGNYESPYVMAFNISNEEHSGKIYLASNSNYVFLLDTESKKITAISRSEVRSFRAK